MKNIIKFESIDVSQSKVIRKNLKLQHLIILDYLNQFFNSGNAIEFIEKNNKIYHLITLNKILEDLPILNIKKRRLQEILHDLVTAKVIIRLTSKKNSPNIFLYIDLKVLQD